MASRQQTLFWGSSYDRGLDVLLYIWPDVLEKFPKAELHICYGWDLFDKAAHNNEERRKWKASVVAMMEQKGIVHYGRVSKSKLENIRHKCGIWAYPTYFQEIFCITAVEAQADGLAPVTMKLAALDETVQAGVKIEGNIREAAVVAEFTKQLLKMMGNESHWQEEAKKGIGFAKNFTWNKIADKWITEFKKPVEQPLVTIYTPTVRDGFWNIMAHNISQQTYSNIEWMVVDDHKDNRAKIMEKYCEKHGIDNYQYLKGKKRKPKRTYGLINANNTAIDAANGELFVFLQDFVLMPKDGIEQLVDVYQHNPDCFIAPVDEYFHPRIKPDTSNKEDWFNGNVDAVGEFMRSNIRVKKLGLRYTDKITDFEQNYGAVPLKILKELGGYYEFFDEALGYDDTEIIYRAFKKDYKLIIDDTNIAMCIDHWQVLGKDEGGTSVNRTRRLNDPRYIWMVQQIKAGKLPLVRNQDVDDKIDLQYEVPEEISDDNVVKWVRKHIKQIVETWK